MKRSTLIIIVFIIVLILVLPVGLWYLVFERPIKTAPDELILTTEDLVGWNMVKREPSEGYSSSGGSWYTDPSTCFWDWVDIDYANSTVDALYALFLNIYSFSSSGHAHYGFLGESSIISNDIKENPLILSLGDEGGRILKGYYSNQYNYSYAETLYILRVANVLVTISFFFHENDEGVLDPNGVYYEPWMDDIALLQFEKIQQHNFRFF